jgi:hypothetical protein
LVNQALANFAVLQSKYGADWENHWNEDPFFSQPQGSSMRVTAQVGRYRETDTYIGDAYNQNGYTGPTTDFLTPDRNVFYTETWAFTAGGGHP